MVSLVEYISDNGVQDKKTRIVTKSSNTFQEHKFKLKDQDDKPRDLTNAEATAYIANKEHILLVKPLEIDNATEGIVKFHFYSDENIPKGDYFLEIRVTYDGGEHYEVFPSKTLIPVTIVEDLFEREKSPNVSKSLAILIDRAVKTTADAVEKGNYAKEQGEYALEQGDYAKEQGELAEDMVNKIRSVLKPIYGIYWDKTANPELTRTYDAIGMVAHAGVDGELVQNDFDNADIYREIGEVKDDYGNVFIRIPKFYIRKRSGKDFLTKEISKTKYPGFYLPAVFWDFENKEELPYYDHGKYKASLSDDNKLESKPDKHPLVSTNIVNFRSYARNNNVDGHRGYQQLDIHAHDVLQTLFHIEFATLNSQSVMSGFTTGRYSSFDVVTVSESNANRAILAKGTASNFRVGQSVGIGSTNSNDSVSGTPRIIVDIYEYDENNSAVEFDGDPIDVSEGDVIANRGYVNGFSADILASSGSIGSNADGKYPCVYRGIESPWGDVYQFLDGLNVSDHQGWIAKNADDYSSNVFASPYEKLGYVSHDVNGYFSEVGYDPDYPFAELPTAIGGGATTYYADYFYQTTGARIALVGGYWNDGAGAGVSLWRLTDSSGGASVPFGGRLLKKAL